MPSGTVIVELPASPEKVWEILTDIEDTPNWVPDLVSVRRLDSGALRVGSQFEQIMNAQGRRMEVKVTIQEFDAPRTIAHSGKGKSVKLSGRATITPTENGCLVTNDWSLELSGFLKLASPIAGNWTKNNIEQSMQSLKEKLEREA